jgi:serine/threonine protein kinase
MALWVRDFIARSTRKLIGMAHVFSAHKGAYALGFLHRDVSDNNIMIDENGRGVLIDWELAIRVKDENGTPIDSKARQRYRTVSHSPAFLWPLVSNFNHRVPGLLCHAIF